MSAESVILIDSRTNSGIFGVRLANHSTKSGMNNTIPNVAATES